MEKFSACSKHCSNCKQPLNLLAIKLQTFAYCQQFKHYLIQSQNARVSFLVTSSKFFMKRFLVEIFVSLFCSSGLLYFFTRVTSQQYSCSKIMQDSSCSGNTQFLFCKVRGFRTRIYFNWAPPERFLKLLRKENLLGCFH